MIIKPTSTDVSTEVRFVLPVASLGDIDVTPEGRVPGAQGLSVTRVIDQGAVNVTLAGGEDGERYSIRMEAEHADSSISERVIEVAVLDPVWSMADGTSGWIDIIEFVERFGLDEIVAATASSSSPGLIDRRFLVGALRDAQADASANLAGRYALPLTAVPDFLKTVVSDLARVRLYPQGLPDSADKAATAARRTLERIASGSLALPGVAGVTMDAAPATDTIEYFADGRAYPDSLAGY